MSKRKNKKIIVSFFIYLASYEKDTDELLTVRHVFPTEDQYDRIQKILLEQKPIHLSKDPAFFMKESEQDINRRKSYGITEKAEKEQECKTM